MVVAILGLLIFSYITLAARRNPLLLSNPANGNDGSLFHSHHTRLNNASVPFLVLVTEDVPQKHCDLLRKDGATVIPVQSLEPDAIKPVWRRWKDLLPRLYLWRITGYDKILYLDADSVLLHPIDEVFSQPAATIRKPRAAGLDDPNDHPLPEHYMIAGTHDPWVEQYLPPVPGRETYELDNFMNAGFFVMQRSQNIFDYYVSRLENSKRCDPVYPEQNLLNCVHRTDGPMPWQDLGSGWNQKKPNRSDYEKGLKSVHHRWWRPLSDKSLQEQVQDVMKEMEHHIRKG
ncbi:glycosyl transferase family 8 family [Penicillium hispanicum]|uniref:glycosyl transferase family 8 family n=1 Tax=Penicillium hispanicum TaxID=1080232 RepID=UPI00253F81F8|nr:glycosyl transferase family 8 family [Penicillium hispanicum]KAJ5569540.1 glycosyl transferase family 8 family [Penicillium hispanicum]